MSFTFDPALSTPISRIRQRLGDVLQASADVQDETITYYLGVKPSELAVAYQLALDLAAQYAKLVDITVDHQLSKASQAFANYTKLAERLEGELRMETVAAGPSAFSGVFATGIDNVDGPYDYPSLPVLPADPASTLPGPWIGSPP